MGGNFFQGKGALILSLCEGGEGRGGEINFFLMWEGGV